MNIRAARQLRRWAKKRMKNPGTIVGVTFLSLMIAFAFTPFARAFRGLISGQRNPSFDKQRLEKIVEKVKEKKLKPGAQVELRVENLSDPGSLRARRTSDNDRGRGAGNVWASKEPGGELVVIIETQDNGHAGTYGYAYSEAAPHQTPEKLWSVGTQTYMSCTEPSWRVAEHWWQVTSCYMD